MIRTLLTLLVVLSPAAQAALQVFPTRLMLNDQKRVNNISLRHLGDQPGHYRVSLVFYRMLPDGGLAPVDKPKPEEHSATTFFKFSPRVVTLKPGVEQVVRVIYAGPKNLPDGEYRAHLHFLPDDPDEESRTAASGKIAMQLSAKVAVAVPLIYRKGTASFTAKIAHLALTKLSDGTPAFTLDMESQGNAFAYGDFHLTFAPQGAAAQDIGLVRGVSSYIPKRKVTYALADLPAGLKLAKGTLRAELRETEDQGGKVLAFTETKLP